VRRTARDRRIAEAQRALALLNFDRERTNERSALILLALLGLRPNSPWSKADNPRLRTVELMAWLRERYGRDYKPNTRETIRRQTLHQFIEAGLVLLNPDDPNRPVNSPNNCYQITPRALELLSGYGTSQFDQHLAAYLDDLPGLRAQYERARTHRQIPVTLPDGSAVTLTPGGQNLLIKQAIEEFCPRFTPGAHVLYVGDAGRKDPIFERDALEDLGVSLDKHGKLPDLIVYLPDQEWLVLIEAAASHGPVDGKRRGELERLFAGASTGLVLVSSFLSRDEMRKYLSEIAWETEVWCADNPSHLIHFNGERFLGPYE
jgi:BsuBI/PstI restriction endonuclease domain/BsuBI/PstI restriction endonuclease HTH domain